MRRFVTVGVKGAALCVLISAPTIALTADADTDAAASGPKSASELDTIVITGERLDEARNRLSPDTGSSVYSFDAKDIAQLPLGSNTPLDQVILQAPGVVQDSFGQLHVRG